MADYEVLEWVPDYEGHLLEDSLNQQLGIASGATTKDWVCTGPDPCAMCRELGEENQEVPIDEPYSNGEMEANAHPRCMCSSRVKHTYGEEI